MRTFNKAHCILVAALGEGSGKVSNLFKSVYHNSNNDNNVNNNNNNYSIFPSFLT